MILTVRIDLGDSLRYNIEELERSVAALKQLKGSWDAEAILAETNDTTGAAFVELSFIRHD